VGSDDGCGEEGGWRGAVVDMREEQKLILKGYKPLSCNRKSVVSHFLVLN
jgi:hypothetical protein